jgi:GLPGLI family protein
MKKILISCVLLIFVIGCKTTKPNEINEKTIVSYKIFELKKTDKPLKYDPSILDFELIYDKNESLFQIVDKLDNSSNNIDAKITKGIYDGHMKFYKNNTEKQKFFNVDEKGVIYNVKTDFENYKWEINPNDTKEISGFKCYKAIAKIERKHNGITQEVFQSFAWFTYEIPTSFGPRGLDGLPGLVLEGSFDGKKVFFATLINKTNRTIEKPIADRTISYEEYSNLKYDSFLEMKKMQQENVTEIEKEKSKLKK